MQELNLLQMEIKHINEKLENIPTRDEMRKDNLELVNTILSQCDDRYASKNIERVVYIITGGVGIWLINTLLELI